MAFQAKLYLMAFQGIPSKIATNGIPSKIVLLMAFQAKLQLMAVQAKLQLILGGFFFLYKSLLIKTNLNRNHPCQCSDKAKNVEVLREVKSQPKIREVPKEFQIALFSYMELLYSAIRN